ncbi:hypothetical protein LguiB_020468 [Lonicera macranthoides]
MVKHKAKLTNLLLKNLSSPLLFFADHIYGTQAQHPYSSHSFFLGLIRTIIIIIIFDADASSESKSKQLQKDLSKSKPMPNSSNPKKPAMKPASKSSSTPAKPTRKRPGVTQQNGEDSRGKKSKALDKDGGIEEKTEAMAALEEPMADEKDFFSTYPRLYHQMFNMENNVYPPLSDDGRTFSKENMSLIGSSKANELDTKWRDLQVEELELYSKTMELYSKRMELIAEQSKLLVDAIKSTGKEGEWIIRTMICIDIISYSAYSSITALKMMQIPSFKIGINIKGGFEMFKLHIYQRKLRNV